MSADSQTQTVIRFYRAGEKPYGVFSNLHRAAMDFEGRIYQSAEAAYQAGKPREDAVREWLLAAPHQHLLAIAAHSLLPWDIVEGWATNRRARMLAVVRAKFHQHDHLARLLLETGTARIAESATTDNAVNRRWGEVLRNGQWIGENALGKILMQVRAEIRGTPDPPGLAPLEQGQFWDP